MHDGVPRLLTPVACVLLCLAAAPLAAPAAIAAPTDGKPIASAHTGKCVDVAQSSGADGGSVIQWPCHKGQNQGWTFDKVYGQLDNVRMVRNVHSNRCLDITGKSTVNGAVAHQWDCEIGRQNKDASGKSQLWQLKPRGSARGWTYYQLVNVNSKKCLDLPNGSNTDGTKLVQWDCNDAQNQQWRILS